MQFLNRLFNKVTFSDAPNLNITAMDMGEEQCTITLEAEGVDRLPVATGTIGSLRIFVPVTMALSIKKTSPILGYYRQAILENGYIGGSVTIMDDVGNEYTAVKPSIAISEMGALNGTQPAVTFNVKANLRVNSKSLVGDF